MKRSPLVVTAIVAVTCLVSSATSAQALEPPIAAVPWSEDGAGLLAPSLEGTWLSAAPTEASEAAAGDGTILLPAAEGGNEAQGFAADESLVGVFVADAGGEGVVEYELTVDDVPLMLSPDDRGAVKAFLPDGTLVNSFAPPLAVDETGREIDSRYEIEGNVLKVVTDAPAGTGDITVQASLECNATFCTSLLSRLETRAAANGDYAVVMAAISLACGPAAGFCGLGMAIITQQAQSAVRKNVCLGLRKTNLSPISWLVHESCRR